MRNAFVQGVLDNIRENKRTLFVTADLGFNFFEPIQEYPDNYLNIGISEQNMAGVAAGMALEGWHVIVYSIGNFSTLRCLEQIRNDICYHDAHVTIVSGGGGLSYGTLGMTHHSTEDIAIMRSLPNMQVFTPANDKDVQVILRHTHSQKSPAYIRLERTSADSNSLESGCVFDSIPFAIGHDITIFSVGSIVDEAMEARAILAKSGIIASVVSLPCIKPIDKKAVIRACQESKILVTLEEHNVIGGLGGAITDVILDLGLNPQSFLKFGLKDEFSATVGTQKYLRKHFGIDATSVATKVKQHLGSGEQYVKDY